MKWSRILVALVVALFAIQLIPVARTNPPVVSAVAAPAEVASILKRACNDCHSHETIWPLQAYVAPLSWYVAHDVKEGREEFNLSDWGPKQAARARKELAKEIEKGAMPPSLYVAAHPEAKLSDADKALLAAWARGL